MGFKEVRRRAERVIARVDERTRRGPIGVLRGALAGFSEANAPEAAAGLAYYAIFSLFPLLLGFASIGGFLLANDAVYQEVLTGLQRAIPFSTDVIDGNLQQVLAVRGSIGLLGLLGLLWSGAGFFTALVRHINRAWEEAPPRSFVGRRLVALAMIGALLALLLLALLTNAASQLVWRMPSTTLGLDIGSLRTLVWSIVSRFVPWLLSFVAFLILFRWIPNTDVRLGAAAWGAGVGALLWQLAAAGFGWYLSSGLGRYELVYGSLGAVIALLFWVYLSSLITLFAVHLTAAIDRAGRP